MSDGTLFDDLMPTSAPEIRTAVISPDGLYRYELTRGEGRLLTFVMLNPSTADAMVNDPTIVRCNGFARDLGHDGIRVVNLYAFRATKPADLWRADDPVGPENDMWLSMAFTEALRTGSTVIAAWGAHAKPQRVNQVGLMAERLEVPLYALHVTRAGAPGHPLYLPATARPRPWP